MVNVFQAVAAGDAQHRDAVRDADFQRSSEELGQGAQLLHPPAPMWPSYSASGIESQGFDIVSNRVSLSDSRAGTSA